MKQNRNTGIVVCRLDFPVAGMWGERCKSDFLPAISAFHTFSQSTIAIFSGRQLYIFVVARPHRKTQKVFAIAQSDPLLIRLVIGSHDTLLGAGRYMKMAGKPDNTLFLWRNIPQRDACGAKRSTGRHNRARQGPFDSGLMLIRWLPQPRRTRRWRCRQANG